jgi:hypothetical protein
VNERVIQSYVFPTSVADPSTALLLDLVLDQPRGFAYISDAGVPTSGAQADFNAGIIVYDFNAKTDVRRSWRLLSRHTSTQPNFGYTFTNNGRAVLPSGALHMGVDGMALTPDGLFLFYSALTDNSIYRIPTCWLRANASTDSVAAATVEAIQRPGAGAGMQFSYLHGPVPTPHPMNLADPCANELSGAAEYELFVTDVENNAVWTYLGDLSRVSVSGAGPSPPTPSSYVGAATGLANWPESLGFGDDGGLLFTATHLNTFADQSMDFTASGNFVLVSTSRLTSDPMYGAQSLVPTNSSVFNFFYGDTTCSSVPYGTHVVNSPDCLYTPNDGTSFQMDCQYNPSTGIVEAHAVAWVGNACQAAQGMQAYGVFPGDGVTCATVHSAADNSVIGSAKVSCANYRPTRVPKPAAGQNVWLWHGLVDECTTPEVSVYYTPNEQCLFTPDHGHSLMVRKVEGRWQQAERGNPNRYNAAVMPRLNVCI